VAPVIGRQLGAWLKSAILQIQDIGIVSQWQSCKPKTIVCHTSAQTEQQFQHVNFILI